MIIVNAFVSFNIIYDNPNFLIIHNILLLLAVNWDSFLLLNIAHFSTFRGNKIVNSIGGILSIAYVSINFVGTNIFSENTGSTISVS